MKERPIIFNSQMVNAILHWRKTQTRRPVTTLTGRIKEFQRSNAKGYDWTYLNRYGIWSNIRHSRLLELCPFGQVGDRLWVRETWNAVSISDDSDPHYAPLIPTYQDADEYKAIYAADGDEERHRWRPSIHMPKWASRITLEITRVRIERAQEITCGDAWAEGVEFTEFYTPDELNDRPFEEKWWDDYHFFTNYPQLVFEKLWKSIYGEESWKQNPLVWVIEFKRI